MRFKFTAVLIALSVVLTIGLIRTVSKVNQQQKLEPTKNRIQWNIDQAKADGRTRVVIGSDTIDYAGTEGSLEQVLAHSTAVIAIPVETRTNETDTKLITWYKLRPIEYLSEVRPSPCVGCDSFPPPQDLLPAARGEFFIHKQGGTIVRDGVQVSQVDSNFPSLTEGQPYLIFMYLHPSGVAWPVGGPLGIYAIAGDEHLVPLNTEPHQLKDEVKDKLNSSLRDLKTKLKKNQ